MSGSAYYGPRIVRAGAGRSTSLLSRFSQAPESRARGDRSAGLARALLRLWESSSDLQVEFAMCC